MLAQDLAEPLVEELQVSMSYLLTVLHILLFSHYYYSLGWNGSKASQALSPNEKILGKGLDKAEDRELV